MRFMMRLHCYKHCQPCKVKLVAGDEETVWAYTVLAVDEMIHVTKGGATKADFG